MCISGKSDVIALVDYAYRGLGGVKCGHKLLDYWVMDTPIGLIAGGGRLPLAAAEGIRAAGRRVACVGLYGEYDSELPGMCDQFKTAGIIQINRWIRTLRRWGCKEAVIVGHVSKLRVYDPLFWFRYIPDLRAGRIWFVQLRRDRRSDKLLGALVDEITSEGITMIDSTSYISKLMANEGVMTKIRPSSNQLADIEFALPIARRMGELDIGQSVAVKSRDIIAVEAIEGTDAMIVRAGGLCRHGGWTLVKVSKPQQDMRFDVPTVGLRTIDNLKANGASCLVVEAERTILLDKLDFLEAANKAKIAVVGVRLKIE